MLFVEFDGFDFLLTNWMLYQYGSARTTLFSSFRIEILEHCRWCSTTQIGDFGINCAPEAVHILEIHDVLYAIVAFSQQGLYLHKGIFVASYGAAYLVGV